MTINQNNISIRPYSAIDRESVRQISCDTADRGGPLENLYPFRDMAADLLTVYYTDYEPQSSWVAESKGRVVGFLTGCMNSRRYNRYMLFKIVPAVLIRAIRTGVLWNSATARWTVWGLKSWLWGGFFRRVSFQRYPAHVHINIDRNFRGQNIGKRLIDSFLGQAREAGCRGGHAVVNRENPGAQSFFEKMGFHIVRRYAITVPDGNKRRIIQSVVYGKVL